MSNTDIRSAKRPDRDKELIDIAGFVCDAAIDNDLAIEMARYCLMDTLACGFQALDDPACTRLLGPVVPGATLAGGARVPGTSYELEPVMAAFNAGVMNCWLDANDTSLAAEWGHPADHLGGILTIADFLSRQSRAVGKEALPMRDVLEAMIRAHQVQGVLALENGRNREGRDQALPVLAATTAVVTRMLGGDEEAVLNALSNAWLDDGTMRNYRHAPNTGSRKSCAAGDVSSRAVRLALIAMTGSAKSCGHDKDSSSTDRIEIDVPGGRRECPAGGVPALQQKFVDSVSPKLGANQWETLNALCADREKLAATAVDDFMALLVA